MRLLFDTSSLIYAIKLSKIELLYDNYLQWLTIYEALNAIWKEAYLVKSITINEANKLVNIFTETIDFMKILSPRNLEHKILEYAKKLHLTAYDTSYIALAEKHNLILVTEDKKLKEKANKIIKTISLNNIVNTR